MYKYYDYIVLHECIYCVSMCLIVYKFTHIISSLNNVHTSILSKQTQLSTAKQVVETYNQQIETFRLGHSKMENEISIASENLQEKKKHLQEKISSQPTPSVGVNQADEIAVQIDITKLNIQLVDLRSEYTLAKTKLRTTQSDLEQRMLSVRLNKNLLVSHYNGYRAWVPCMYDI